VSAKRTELVSILIAIAIFALLSIVAAVSSDGFLEADSCTHYLYARFAFQQPHYFVNIWGRPICTAVYAVPAMLGARLGVRFMSLGLAIGCGLVAYRIAKNQGYRWPALALIFTLAQPLVFLHSFSELTELPFALLIGLAFWMYQTRRWLLMAIFIGLSPLSRPEGFGFIVLAVLALILHRRWWWIPILLIPLVIWDYSGWVLYGRSGPWWNWLRDQWPYAGDSLYEHGTVFHFLKLMPAVTSPLVFPASCVGIWRSLTPSPRTRGEGRGEGPISKGPPSPAPHPNPLPEYGARGPDGVQSLIAVIPLLIFFGHTLLYATGKMASSGELRYMLVVAPFWGLLSAFGWEWLETRLHWRRPIFWAGVVAILPIAANRIYQVVPLVPDVDWLRAKRAVTWYQHSGLNNDFPKIATAHQGIFYFLDVAPTDGRRIVEWRKDELDHPKPGTLVIWDPMYSIYNSDAKRSVPVDELRQAGWIDITDNVATIGPGWHVLISPMDANGQRSVGRFE
jgi:hypothetical protein